MVDRRRRSHLQVKLAKSKDAAELQTALLTAGAELARHIMQLAALMAEARKVAMSQDDIAT